MCTTHTNTQEGEQCKYVPVAHKDGTLSVSVCSFVCYCVCFSIQIHLVVSLWASVICRVFLLVLAASCRVHGEFILLDWLLTNHNTLFIGENINKEMCNVFHCETSARTYNGESSKPQAVTSWAPWRRYGVIGGEPEFHVSPPFMDCKVIKGVWREGRMCKGALFFVK